MERPRFLLDQNVHRGVATWLEDWGYAVFHVRDVLAADSPDALIAFVASRDGLVLITHDADFRHIGDLLPTEERTPFRAGAGRILLRVSEAHARDRLEAEWESVLFFYGQALSRGIRCLLTITGTGITATTNSPLEVRRLR